mmetsp:Transcript_6026/g.19953  ORF Transcript_6026/g.19953 Transcript_6026/m.19953 type:complete len:284 (-) Transcript_6026:773-1624(-)
MSSQGPGSTGAASPSTATARSWPSAHRALRAATPTRRPARSMSTSSPSPTSGSRSPSFSRSRRAPRRSASHGPPSWKPSTPPLASASRSAARANASPPPAPMRAAASCASTKKWRACGRSRRRSMGLESPSMSSMETVSATRSPSPPTATSSPLARPCTAPAPAWWRCTSACAPPTRGRGSPSGRPRARASLAACKPSSPTRATHTTRRPSSTTSAGASPSLATARASPPAHRTRCRSWRSVGKTTRRRPLGLRRTKPLTASRRPGTSKCLRWSATSGAGWAA